MNGGDEGEPDPGNEELDWLEQQLKLARKRKLQVWLTGHVPPSYQNWYSRCFSRYAQLMLVYQDTIVGFVLFSRYARHFPLLLSSSLQLGEIFKLMNLVAWFQESFWSYERRSFLLYR